MENLIRRNVLRRLTCFCTVCQCLTKKDTRRNWVKSRVRRMHNNKDTPSPFTLEETTNKLVSVGGVQLPIFLSYYYFVESPYSKLRTKQIEEVQGTAAHWTSFGAKIQCDNVVKLTWSNYSTNTVRRSGPKISMPPLS